MKFASRGFHVSPNCWVLKAIEAIDTFLSYNTLNFKKIFSFTCIFNCMHLCINISEDKKLN